MVGFLCATYLTISALGKCWVVLISRPFWLCSSTAIILCLRCSFSVCCLSKMVFKCSRNWPGKSFAAALFQLSFSLAACNNGSRTWLILLESFPALAGALGTVLELTISVLGIVGKGTESSSLELLLEEGLLHKDDMFPEFWLNVVGVNHLYWGNFFIKNMVFKEDLETRCKL